MNVVVVKNKLCNLPLEELKDSFFDAELSYLASDLFNYGFADTHEMDFAVQRSISICKTAGLNIKHNFKPVYVFKNSEIICDWRLSELARKLILLNGNTENPFVARLQLELLGKF